MMEMKSMPRYQKLNKSEPVEENTLNEDELEQNPPTINEVEQNPPTIPTINEVEQNPPNRDEVNQDEVEQNPPNRDEVKQSPNPHVESIVSMIDDPNLPTLTFRMWVLGISACALQGFLQARAMFYKDGFDLALILVYIVTYGMGWFMAAVLPQRFVNVPLTGGFRFALNPGPFNSKEHVLVCVFTFIGRMRPLLLQTIAIIKVYNDVEIYPMAALMATLSSYLLSFGFVGLFFNWVSSPVMWWPSNVQEVIFFRTLHGEIDVPSEGISDRTRNEEDVSSEGISDRTPHEETDVPLEGISDRTLHEEIDPPSKGFSNKRFFATFLALGFGYQLIPGFFFPGVSAISMLCWFSKDSTTTQQVGDGRNGLRLLSFSLNLPFASDFTGDPLCTPRFVLFNVLAGCFIIFYMVTPFITDSFKKKLVPILSTQIYDSCGRIYNFSRILNDDGLTLNEEKYKEYSPVYLGPFTITSICFMVASVSTSLIQVAVNFGRDICKEVNEDFNNILMRSYHPVPRRWFFVVCVTAFVLALFCFGMGFGPHHLQFPLTVMLVSCVIALPLVIPVGVILATANQMLPVSIVSRLIGGLLYPTEQLPYMIFTNFTYQLVTNAVSFLSCFKLGHYMKIAPQAMFIVEIVASIISVSTGFGTTWYYANVRKLICNQKNPDTGARFNCPLLDKLNGTANMWGVVGTRRIIQDGGYTSLFLAVIGISMVAQILVSISSRKWKIMRHINLPIILGATQGIPPTLPATINTWLVVGIAFPFIASKYFKSWWSPKYQYLFSTSIVAGSSGMNVLLSIIQNLFPFGGWGSKYLDNQCPLANPPTTPGVMVEGCS